MEKYYTTYPHKSITISYKPIIKPVKKKKRENTLVRGVYDIETNNEVGKFIVGGLALWNGRDEEDTKENYNISFHNKPYLIIY